MYSNLNKPIREMVQAELQATTSFTSSFERCRAILAEIETLTNSRVISYFTSFKQSFGVIDDDAILIEDLIRTTNTNKPLVLILSSPGGQAVAAEKILNVCRSYADLNQTSFTAFIPKSAKSAATIIALGADKILMSQAAELGPIDPQIIVSNPVETGKETETEILDTKTKVIEKKVFAQSSNVIPAIRIIKAVDNLMDGSDSFFSWLKSKKSKEHFLTQYAYDLYLMAKNELRLSKDILEKIVERKKRIGDVQPDFIKALEIFLEPDLTLSHNRPITLLELTENPLKRDGFINSYVDEYRATGLEEEKIKSLDALLWEYYVRTNMHIEDGGNPISKTIESSSSRFHLSPDGQVLIS